MATAEYSATVGSVKATAQSANLVGKTFSAASTLDTDVDASVTAATTADTDVGTTVTDLATAFTDFNTFAAAVITITGDTFDTGTHQFTFGGATGLTHAQWATLGAQLNTAATDFVTAQTANTTAKTATATAKTAATLAQTDSDALQTAIAAVTADIIVYIGSVSNVASLDILHQAFNAVRRVIAGSNLLAVGSPTPRSP